ncbi:MAG TPA: signal peptide peptidase SppA, partial [Candidatus Brocadiia bacterium]|nr:signal peptide peptidase SppA [Candidatus Brocadiia bacterium]
MITRRGTRWLLIVGLLALVCAAPGCVYVAGFGTPDVETVVVASSPAWFETNRVAIIDVKGFLASEDAGSLFRGYCTTIADVRERLDRAAEDWRVKAVVLRVNCPGGEVTASDIIHREIRDFRASTGKPVVASILSVGASGGYYVATASQSIYACPTALTGSVGVIMEYFNVKNLLAKVGVEPVVVKSGEMKDIGSMTRAMTPDERRVLQGINTAMFSRFVDVVRAGRPGMTEENLNAIKDGRVVDAATALKLGMVDRIGYLNDAIEEAKQLANITSADVVLYRRGKDPYSNIYAEASAGAQPENW